MFSGPKTLGGYALRGRKSRIIGHDDVLSLIDLAALVAGRTK